MYVNLLLKAFPLRSIYGIRKRSFKWFKPQIGYNSKQLNTCLSDLIEKLFFAIVSNDITPDNK